MQSNQDSNRNKMRGLLTMASTHIGNLKDTPARTLELLKNSDLLVFEEDKPARQLLKHAKIHRDYIKVNEHKNHADLSQVKKALKSGQSVLYCSDQGMPNLADPGKSLLDLAYQLDSQIKVIPGPSSITAALAVCPFEITKFNYLGFLPREIDKREKELKKYATASSPLVILDTPYRLKQLLASLSKILGAKRKASLSIDISGPCENHLTGSIESLIDKTKNLEKLNFVIIVNS